MVMLGLSRSCLGMTILGFVHLFIFEDGIEKKGDLGDLWRLLEFLKLYVSCLTLVLFVYI